MRKIRRVDITMSHATPWHAQATGEASAPRGSVVAVRSDSRGGRPADRRHCEFSVSLAAGVPAGGQAGTERQADAGAASAPVPPTEASTREALGPGAGARRPSDRPVDAAAG